MEDEMQLMADRLVELIDKVPQLRQLAKRAIKHMQDKLV